MFSLLPEDPISYLTDDIVLKIFLDIGPIRDYVIDHSEFFISDLINQKAIFRKLVIDGIMSLYPGSVKAIRENFTVVSQ